MSLTEFEYSHFLDFPAAFSGEVPEGVLAVRGRFNKKMEVTWQAKRRSKNKESRA